MRIITLLTLCGLCITTAQAQRTEALLEKDWSFSRDKAEWQTVRVPHGWAIAGPFDKKWDLQTVAIEEDREVRTVGCPAVARQGILQTHHNHT